MTYTDQKVVYEHRKLKQTGYRWVRGVDDEERLKARLEALEATQKVSLLFRDDRGYWTYSGLADYVSAKTKDRVVQTWTRPEPKLIPWNRPPAFQMHPYQAEALEALLKAGHAGVSMGTGLGKSFIIANLVKRLGLKTVVMAPSSSITDQLLADFREWFGDKYVGSYTGKKKRLDKLITVATAQSLTRVEEGSPAWEALQEVDVFVADESHQCPASTLARVCFGALGRAPYRFFFSATQVRGDGSKLLLDAITGPIVYDMTVRQGVDGGYLAKPRFRMFDVSPNGEDWYQDPNQMTRHHLFYNPKVIEAVGKLANTAASAGMPVLVLVEEVEQFTKLLPYLRHRVGFAHGGLSSKLDSRGRQVGNIDKVPEDFRDSDPTALVKEFNAGRLPILVGTSCISTGTDVKAVKFLIYWQGGKSEVQVKQAVGRGTRLFPGKTFCHVVDFWVHDKRMNARGKMEYGPVGRHAKVRKGMYEEIYGPVVISRLDG